MNAFELFNERGKPIGIFACGKCRKLTLGFASGTEGGKNSRESAEACCQPPVCRYCNQPVPDGQRNDWHDECAKEREDKRYIERLEAAELVTDYDGMIWSHEVSGYHDGYFRNVDELKEALGEYCESEQCEPRLPEFAFCCTPDVFTLDLDRAIESACEELYEDAYDHLGGIKELQAAVDKFNELNKNVIGWNPDYKRKVAVQ